MSGRKRRTNRNESAQGHISHVIVGSHLIINKVKKRDNLREARAQDGHTVVADSSRMLCRALMFENLVVHAGRGKRDMCRVMS
jgi:hypothetical protein